MATLLLVAFTFVTKTLRSVSPIPLFTIHKSQAPKQHHSCHPVTARFQLHWPIFVAFLPLFVIIFLVLNSVSVIHGKMFSLPEPRNFWRIFVKGITGRILAGRCHVDLTHVHRVLPNDVREEDADDSNCPLRILVIMNATRQIT